MATIPIRFIGMYACLEDPSGLWVIDTGSGTTLGDPESFVIEGLIRQKTRPGFVDAETIRRKYNLPAVGLVGTDVINRFDWIIDIPNEVATVSTEPLPMEGVQVPVEVNGVTGIDVEIDGTSRRFIMDTGARISYITDAAPGRHPDAGRFQDFNPHVGDFASETRTVPVSVEGVPFSLRVGILEGIPLAAFTTFVTGFDGVLGVEFMAGRKVGYAPRRGLLAL